MTEAKDWAGELISGQTTTGRILVSAKFELKIWGDGVGFWEFWGWYFGGNFRGYKNDVLTFCC